MKKIFYFLFATTISFNAFAQELQENLKVPHIKVTGRSEMYIEPDIINVSVTITEKNINGKKQTVDEVESTLFYELKQLGIDKKKINFTDAGTEVTFITRKNKKILSTKSYNLKLSSVAETSNAFKVFDKMDIKNASVASYDVSNRIELVQKLRVEAIKMAKKKANYLLEGIEQSAGKALFVEEENGFNNVFLSNNIISNSSYQTRTVVEKEEEPLDIAIQKVKLEAGVTVIFEIK